MAELDLVKGRSLQARNQGYLRHPHCPQWGEGQQRRLPGPRPWSPSLGLNLPPQGAGGEEEESPRPSPDAAMPVAPGWVPQRRGQGQAHHVEGSPPEVTPLPRPCQDTACRAPCSRLAISGAVSQGIGDLAERGPVLGTGRPAALHQPVELGWAAFRLREPSLPGLQVCGKKVGTVKTLDNLCLQLAQAAA